MKQDFFANLPSDIIIDILSRLPIRTIISCKFVRKSWLALLQTPDFANFHLLKEVVGLVFYENMPRLYTIYEFEDALHLESHELNCSSVIKFNLPFQNGWVGGSVDGLLLHCYLGKPLSLYICNPITRDYIKIQRPQELRDDSCPRLVALGFGASKINGQHFYKVVTVFKESTKSECNCYVYTIGTGVWRKITPPTGINMNGCRIIGVFLNGNLHWLVSDLKASQPWISCFDLENELFSAFSSPLMAGSNTSAAVLCPLGETLCLSGNRPDGINIWLMKEYGVDMSWTKQFVIRYTDFDQYSYQVIYPIKVSKDGDVLMAWKLTNFLFYYSRKNNVVQKIDMFESCANAIPFIHKPSFLSLKSYERENVRSF